MLNAGSLLLPTLGIFITCFVGCGQEREDDIPMDTSNQTIFEVETVVEGIAIPWGMAFLPDGAMLITEKSGELIHFKDGMKTTVGGLPEIYVRGQGGLLDVELHPQYSDNGWVYLSYSSSEGPESGGNTAIIRGKLQNLQLVEEELLYKATPNTTEGRHFGSRLAFDDQGYLYFTVGDRGNRDGNPQDIARDGGKVYRLHDDGSIPSDNPFIDESFAKSAIFSYGHRNAQGMTKNPFTGAIWTHEHGPRGGDEINIIQKGRNYGWPIITYGLNYDGTPITDETSRPGMEQPLYYWTPSIAPSGMTFVSSDRYPNWEGNLLVGSLKFQYLERLVLENGQVVQREELLDDIGRLRNVKQGPDGFIYVAVEGKGILRLVPTAE